MDAVADADDVRLEEVRTALASDLERIEREGAVRLRQAQERVDAELERVEQAKRSDARAKTAGGEQARRRSAPDAIAPPPPPLPRNLPCRSPATCRTRAQADSTWTITAFAASLGVSGSVSEALQDGAPVPAAGEFEFIQSLAGRPVDEIEAKLRAGRLVERVAGVLSRGAAELKTPLVATGAELNKKFAADAFKGEMGFGGTAEFYGGLEGIIGSPTRTVQVADIGADLCGAAHSRERRRAAPQATTNRSIMGRQIYFVPIDLVEDRARTRVVGVAVMTAVYRLGPKPAPGRTLVLLPRGIGLHCSQRKVGSGTGPRGRIRSPDPTPTFCWHQNGGSANSIAEHMLMCM